MCLSVGNAFQFDLCRFVCLVGAWMQQAEECNFPLPKTTAVIDESKTIDEQWEEAVMWWQMLSAAWTEEAARRGVDTTPKTITGQQFSHNMR